ncbi:pep-cterm sorting domain-containing protein [Anaeramoeba ignava]|uniref:Pep-cterm sorting domain-containing protein n=1 Tax=Anaeramoeba ignava TaxID=1746090 RepID=A0A9Q0RD60_ANAIG|nr:pep-cterm sorting domain-containing protein [Anaeramoeba ignava]
MALSEQKIILFLEDLLKLDGQMINQNGEKKIEIMIMDGLKPEKFPIKQQKEEYAIYYHLNHGPIFGCDIYLDSNLQPGCSNFGNSYNLPNGIKYGTNEVRSYLAGSWNKWVVDEVESYFI